MVVVVVTMMMVAMTMMVMVLITMITNMMMVMDRYVYKQQMRRYHDSIIVSCVSYSENTFSNRLFSFLDGLSYPVDNDDASYSSSSS